MEVDGWITIGARVTTSQLEKDYNKLVRELESKEKDAEKLAKIKAEVEADLEPLRKQEESLQKVQRRMHEINQLQGELNAQRSTIQEGPELDAWYEKTQALTKEYNELLKTEEEISAEVSKTGTDYSTQINKINEINQQLQENKIQQDDIKKKAEEINVELGRRKIFGDIKGEINGITNEMKKMVRQALRWGLAIVGVRSAYSFITTSMTRLSQQDEQLKADLDYMKTAIASTIAPFVKKLVDFLYTILGYVRYIIYQWTGKDIFANASKYMAKTSKDAKELKKTLAGFDEMTILGNIASNSGISSDVSPREIPELGDGDVPEWIKWIAKHKDEIIKTLGIIVGLIGAFKIANLIIQLERLGGILKPLWAVIKLIGTFISTNAPVIGGLILTIGGIAVAVKGLLDYLENPTWDNLWQILIGIGIEATGLFLLGGPVVALVGALISLLITLGAVIVKNWDSIKHTWNELKEHIFPGIMGIIETIARAITQPFVFVISLIQEIWSGFSQVFGGILKFLRGDFKGGISDVFSGIKTILLAPINALIDAINHVIKGVNKIKFSAPDWVPGIGGKSWGFNLKSIPKLERGGIVNNPGPGVMMGSYIAGEREAEAVLPLTDEVFDKLGESIARHTSIYANITNTMNGRVISRELQKLQNERDFALNL